MSRFIEELRASEFPDRSSRDLTLAFGQILEPGKRDDHSLRSYFWQAREILLAAEAFLADERSGRNAKAKALRSRLERVTRTGASVPERVSLDDAGREGTKKWIPDLKNSNSIRKWIYRLGREKRLPPELLRFATIENGQPIAVWLHILTSGTLSKEEADAINSTRG